VAPRERLQLTASELATLLDERFARSQNPPTMGSARKVATGAQSDFAPRVRVILLITGKDDSRARGPPSWHRQLRRPDELPPSSQRFRVSRRLFGSVSLVVVVTVAGFAPRGAMATGPQTQTHDRLMPTLQRSDKSFNRRRPTSSGQGELTIDT